MRHNFVANGVTVHYKGGERALREFDLNVTCDCLAIIGLSLDGKTTLVNAISGLCEYSGNFVLDGKELSKKPDGKVQSVLEDYCLQKRKTVRENIEFPLKIRKMDLSIADKAIKDFGLSKFQDIKAKNIADNVKPYIALSRLSFVERELYVFDDILKPLREEDKVIFIKKIKEIFSNLKGMKIYVTSNIEEAKELGDIIVVLYGGVIEQVGTYDELLEKPLSRRVLELVSKPTFFETILEENDGKLFVKIDDEIIYFGSVEYLIDKRYIGKSVQIAKVGEQVFIFDSMTDKIIIPY